MGELGHRSRVLVSGGAGFIGSHLVDSLLAEGHSVTVVDNFDCFYDPGVKEINVFSHLQFDAYKLIRADIRDVSAVRSLAGPFDVIVHLAAKAGVLPSMRNPVAYQEVNIRGTLNLLELAKDLDVRQFVFASSSSVYGVNPNVPWREDESQLEPISPYAASKAAGELLGRVYSHLYGLRFLALRIFTVYGPRQRPDLAIHKFARRMLNKEPIPVYGDGTSMRDYTFVGDIIQGIKLAMGYQDSSYEVINLGNGHPVTLDELIEGLEQALGVTANREVLPDQPGDVPRTFASTEKAKKLLGYRPDTSLTAGLTAFGRWLADS